jgi:hypothetical protein
MTGKADRRRPARALAGLAAVALLPGCAAIGDGDLPVRPSVRAGEFGEASCFLRRTVMDFEVLDDRNLIVFAPGRSEPYHMQVSPGSSGLRHATVLAFEASSAQICGYAGDSLLVEQPGGGLQRLSVIGVYRLDEPALAGLEARFGKAVAPARPAPQPAAGAEIERDLGQEPQH